MTVLLSVCWNSLVVLASKLLEGLLLLITFPGQKWEVVLVRKKTSFHKCIAFHFIYGASVTIQRSDLRSGSAEGGAGDGDAPVS